MTPKWLDREAYPFEPRWLQTPDGRMHYIDEGRGPAVVMVHGTPTWSFLYRHLIGGLRGRYRVIAPDHLGFGLSEKPPGAGYRPADHANRLRLLIDTLRLEDVALVVHDFGGPIGLSYAIEQPDNAAALVLFNTWMWRLEGNPDIERASEFFGGRLGQFLYRRLNFAPRVLVKAAWGRRAALAAAVHRHYMKPFGSAGEREAPATLPRELIASGDWFDDLWRRREAIRDKPALLIWGLRDPAFGAPFLDRWEAIFSGVRTIRLAEAGHFVPDEAGQEVVPDVRSFLDNTVRRT